VSAEGRDGEKGDVEGSLERSSARPHSHPTQKAKIPAKSQIAEFFFTV
jgi:hypothetical protein